MSEPRIRMLSEEDALKAAADAGVNEFMAKLSIFRVLLNHPRVARQMHDMLVALLFDAELDTRLRELLILRLGWMTGSVYEWTQHWRVALDLGLPETDLLAVRDWRKHDRWSDGDRAVLAATDEVLTDGAISAETWAKCAAALPGARAQIELVSAIGWWRMISHVLRSLEIPLEDGVTPWPPDGAKP